MKKIFSIAVAAVMALAVFTGCEYKVETYTAEVKAPTITSSKNSVTIACATSSDATIYYTTDGSTPTTSSTKYEKAFKITDDETAEAEITVKAFAVWDGISSEVATQKCKYTPAKTDEGGDEETTTGIVAGSTKIAFSECEIKDVYCGTYDGKNNVVAEGGELIISIDEVGVLTLAGYNWDSETITLKNAIDLSSYTKMTINAKCASKYTAGDAIIFELGDSDGGSTGYNSWTDANFLKFTAGFSEFSVDLEKLTNQGANSKIGSTDINLKKVDKIVINPRGASGNFYIASIVFE